MKKTLLVYIGDYTTQLYGDYFINYEIRISIKQPVERVFFRGSD